MEYLAYLSRYLTVFFLVSGALTLLFYALRSWSRRFKRQISPVKGFFLLSEQMGVMGEVTSYPLYYTTGIGRSGSSDVRIKGKGILRHHAQLFLFKGRWYLEKDQARAQIWVNREKLTGRRQVNHKDVISIPGKNFTFIDERRSAKESGIEYDDINSYDDLSSDREERTPRRVITYFSLYWLISLFQLWVALPEELGFLRNLALILGAVYMLLMMIFARFWVQMFDHFDEAIYLAFAMMSGIGFVLQTRLSLLNRTKPDAWTDMEWYVFLQNDMIKQAIFYFAGIIILPLLIFIFTKTKLLEHIAPLCLWITPGLYLSTKILGRDVAGTGAGLWLVLPGGFTLQLTEFAKITYLIVLAYFFVSKPSFKRQVLFGLWAGINFILILWLPDLGSMMILLPVTLLVYTVMSSEYFKTLLILASGIGLFALAYRLMPYVKRRVHGWLTLWEEVNAQNDQIIRGLQAMTRGGLIGTGLGSAEPRSIPLASSDMVFSFLTEELGLLTALVVVLLFMVILIRAGTAFVVLRDSFTAALILGIASYFFVEASVAIAGVSGLIPLTGVTLPFIARGGSSMLAKWVLVAMILALWNRREERRYKS